MRTPSTPMMLMAAPITAALIALATSTAAQAQDTAPAPTATLMTPVGLWRSVDDESGQPKSEVRISASPQDGTLSGRVEKILRPGTDPAAVCSRCEDDRKNQPILGLEIIRAVQPSADGKVWSGGTILDPENGRTYTLRLTPSDQGQRLQVRGSFGPFWRTQVWQRVQ